MKKLIICFSIFFAHTYANLYTTYKDAIVTMTRSITSSLYSEQLKKVGETVYRVFKDKERERRMCMAFCLLYLGTDNAEKRSKMMHTILPISLGIIELGCLTYEQLYLPVPPVLKNLKNIELITLPVLQQKEGSCGWHSVINALGVQQAANQGLFEGDWHENAVKKVMGDVRDQWFLHINCNAQSIMHAIGVPQIFDELHGHEQDKLAHIIGLKNYYITYIKEGEASYYTHDVFEGYKSPNNYYKIDDIASFFNHMRMNPAPIKHILFGCPGSYDNNHGVTLSLIARTNKKPLLIYTDSNNTPLIELGSDCINSYFVVKFILELDKNI